MNLLKQKNKLQHTGMMTYMKTFFSHHRAPSKHPGNTGNEAPDNADSFTPWPHEVCGCRGGTQPWRYSNTIPHNQLREEHNLVFFFVFSRVSRDFTIEY